MNKPENEMIFIEKDQRVVGNERFSEYLSRIQAFNREAEADLKAGRFRIGLSASLLMVGAAFLNKGLGPQGDAYFYLGGAFLVVGGWLTGMGVNNITRANFAKTEAASYATALTTYLIAESDRV